MKEESNVVFDDKQQARVNEIIQDRLKRQKAADEKKAGDDLAALTEQHLGEIEKLRIEYEEKLAAMSAKAAPSARAKTDTNGDNNGSPAAAIADPPTPSDAVVANDTEKKPVSVGDEPQGDEFLRLKTEGLILQKKNALLQAVTLTPFINPAESAELLDRLIELEPDGNGGWLVKVEKVIQQDENRNPLSVAAYVQRWAAKRPYLIRSQVLGGTGSAESAPVRRSAVLRKSDCKTPREASQWIKDHSLREWERLPL